MLYTHQLVGSAAAVVWRFVVSVGKHSNCKWRTPMDDGSTNRVTTYGLCFVSIYRPWRRNTSHVAVTTSTYANACEQSQPPGAGPFQEARTPLHVFWKMKLKLTLCLRTLPKHVLTIGCPDACQAKQTQNVDECQLALSTLHSNQPHWHRSML